MAMLKPKEYAKAENWKVFTSWIPDRKSDNYKYLVEHKADFVKNVGADKVNMFMEGLFYWDVLSYATAHKEYDAMDMAQLFNEMQKAELPDSCDSYSLYKVAQLRGAKKYSEMLDYLRTQGKALGASKIYVDMSLNKIDGDEQTKNQVLAFLREEQKQYQGTHARRLEDLIRSMEHNGGIEFADPFGVKKIGVPSMGGIIIIVSILVPVLLLGRLRNIYLLLMIVTTVWLGFLGGMDDFIKIFRHNKEGLKGRYKIVGQVGIGLIVGLVLWASPDVKMNENLIYEKQSHEVVVKHRAEARKSLKTTIPFVKGHNLDYSRITSVFGEHRVAAGWILFVIMTIIVVTAVSNGANLNDGMDGMCAGNSAIIGVALGILAYVSSHIEYASYLNIMYIPDSQELVVFLCAFVGALIGFLWYNAYPAQVFMGDTGSLTIGGIIAVTAIIIHKELMLPILCGIFFVESLSVILQVYYYKLGKRRGVKQRIFKRTPIHDNFRTQQSQLDPECHYLITKPKGAIHESKITIRFWITTIILAALTIITLKIR